MDQQFNERPPRESLAGEEISDGDGRADGDPDGEDRDPQAQFDGRPDLHRDSHFLGKTAVNPDVSSSTRLHTEAACLETGSSLIRL